MVRGAWCNSRLKVQALNAIAKTDIRENIQSSSCSQKCIETRNYTRVSDFSNKRELVSEVKDKLFSKSSLAQGADTNIVQYLGIAADEPERIKRHTRPGIILPLVKIGWNEAYCRQWCEENDLLSPIYTTSARGGCWFCHNQSVEQLRLLRKNYPDLWELLLKWDWDSPVNFHPDGRTVHDFDLRFYAEDLGLVPTDRKFRWAMLDNPELFKEGGKQ